MRKIAYVIDRNHEPPAWGEESKAKIKDWSTLPHRGAFWKHWYVQYNQLQQWVKSPAAFEKLRRAETGLGKTEGIQPGDGEGVFDELKKEKPKNHFTVGIIDDVTHTSLDYAVSDAGNLNEYKIAEYQIDHMFKSCMVP